MFERLVAHLEDSRIFARSEKPSICLKQQSKITSTRITASYPFCLQGDVLMSNKGFDKASFHPSFAPGVPAQVSLKNNGDFSSNFNFNFRLNSEKVPEKYKENTIHFGFYGNLRNYFSGVIGIKHENQFSLSLTANPFILGFTYHGEKFGGEFSYSFSEQQPAASILYNQIIDRTQISCMGSMYGIVAALVTSDFDKFSMSSYFDANVFSFDSKVVFGLQIPFENSFANFSFSMPSKVATVEIAMNTAEEDGMKQGITAYLPIDVSSIMKVFQ